MSKPTRIGDLLRAYAARLGIAAALEEAEVLAAWATLYGEQEELRAEAFRSGTLVVAARNAAAAQELVLRREQVRAELNGRLGKPLVRAVRVIQRAEQACGSDVYLHLGAGVVVPYREVVAILDARSVRGSETNQAFLRRAAESGRLFGIHPGQTRSLVVTLRGVYASSVSPKTLARRAQVGLSRDARIG